MKGLGRKFRIVLTLAVAATALAVVTSPASASEVKAKFSASTLSFTTSGVTIKKNGEDPRTCKFGEGAIAGFTSENSFVTGFGGYPTLYCPTPAVYLEMNFTGKAWYNTVTSAYTLEFEQVPFTSLHSPWGIYTQTSPTKIEAVWTNGSGGTSSTFKFSNEEIGQVVSTGAKITMDGTFTAKTSAGGLLTLSH